MLLHNTNLSFQVVESNSCKTLILLDTSYYNPDMTISGGVLQILVPGYSEPIETTFNKSAITVLTSNSLEITNISSEKWMTDLPDGAYTAKISICPYDKFWFEDTWYRTCQLECKFDKAFLKLDLVPCDNCFNAENMAKLTQAGVYIQGVHSNMVNNNLKAAKDLYKAADDILNSILECDCDGSIKIPRTVIGGIR